MTALFFDDHRLFGRDGLVRRYGVPRLLIAYTDGVSSTDLSGSWCFRLDDGTYRLLYMGQTEDGSLHLFSAIGTDGVHFAPESLSVPHASYPHEIPMPFGPGCEVAAIYEDTTFSEADYRYRMLFTRYSECELYVHDVIYHSPDLIHWTLDELRGKTLIVELRLEDGEVYALRGSFRELYNTEAARYRVLGVLPR